MTFILDCKAEGGCDYASCECDSLCSAKPCRATKPCCATRFYRATKSCRCDVQCNHPRLKQKKNLEIE